MTRTELAELIRNGETSGAEFKRDDVHADSLAKEMAALLNLKGGHILLGVENDGTVSGLTRDPHEAEEWVGKGPGGKVGQRFTPFGKPFGGVNDQRGGVVRRPPADPARRNKPSGAKPWRRQPG